MKLDESKIKRRYTLEAVRPLVKELSEWMWPCGTVIRQREWGMAEPGWDLTYDDGDTIPARNVL